MGMGPAWRLLGPPELRCDDINNKTSENILIWHVIGKARSLNFRTSRHVFRKRISREDWVLVLIGFPGLPRVTGKQAEK